MKNYPRIIANVLGGVLLIWALIDFIGYFNDYKTPHIAENTTKMDSATWKALVGAALLLVANIFIPAYQESKK